MLVINHLTKAGDIKKVLLQQTEVTVTTIDNQVIVYRRFDGDIQEARQ